MSNDFAGSAPIPSFLAGGDGAVISAPIPTLSSEGATFAINFEGTTSAPTLSAAGVSGLAGDFAGRVPVPTLSATLDFGQVISFDKSVPVVLLTASILTGHEATFAGSAPAPTLVSFGWPENTATFAGRAPVPYLSSILGTILTSNYRTWVLNTEKGALTEYDFEFNSYAVFNGVVLACGDSGVVVLNTSGLDNTTNIDATFMTGKEHFASSYLKRVPRIYLGHHAGGDLHFSTITSEGGERKYLLPWNNMTDLQQRRIPVGKGPKSRWWQFKLANVGGADFDVNDIIVYPSHLKRRIQ